jgi:hypothetical protein
MRGKETVTRLRGVPVLDPYSGDVTGLEWPEPPVDPLPIEGCLVGDGGSIEPLRDARNSVESDFGVLAPSGADVTAADRLVVRGLTCQVVGRPFDWGKGMTINAKIAEG